MRILPILPITLVGILLGLFLADVGKAQDPVAFPVPTELRDPYWNSINIEDHTPSLLLHVPEGRRFVLTDLWFLSKEGQYLPTSDMDRVWLECQHGTNRWVVFDSPLSELPSPLRWQTGVVFQEGQEMWINYRTAGKTDLLRRIHFTGYFEDTLPTPRR